MQVSGLSSSSAAMALRELFQQQSATTQELPSARQNDLSGVSKAMQGISGAQMSSDTMSALLGLQTAPPSASDLAANLVSDLDANGDGSLSTTELGVDSDSAAEAFATIDSNSDGALTSDELSAAFEAAGPPSFMEAQASGSSDFAAELASMLMEQLSASEKSETNASSEDQDNANTSLSSYDSDGDGALSLAELTAAIGQYLPSNAQRVDATSVTTRA